MELLDIAIGKHRNTRTWQNVQMSWEDFAHKCSITNRTAEKYSEYLAAPKSRQDEIKDYWPYVAAYLVNGRRKIGSIMHRSMLTLDADFAKPELWENFQMMLGCTGLMYSTHKHSPSAHRVRLVIPTDRPLAPSEYEPVARKVADMLGIEQFDHTTYDVNRLMYGPSTSKDGEFLYEFQEGEALAADQILDLYRNWRDVSEWPRSDREHKAIKAGVLKAEDPLTKEGLVGVFCRTYSVGEVIEKFLGDVYEPAGEGRWSYKGGSTAGGAVEFENGKFMYSYHATDLASGRLCNAFDLPRIHLYGSKDESAPDGTPMNRLPSYLAMLDFASKDVEVRKMSLSEKLIEAGVDFRDSSEDGSDAADDAWMAELEVDRKNNPANVIKNFRLIMENDPRLKGALAKDLFSMREVALRDLPWRKAEKGEFLVDSDSTQLREFIESNYGLPCLSKNFSYAESNVFANQSYHPIKEYLGGLGKWDGQSRIDTLFVDYLGADDSPYVRAVSRKSLVAAIARIYKPGVKFDYVTTFVGKEGIQKSALVEELGGEWFSGSFGDLNKGNSAEESLQGVWLMEIGELKGMDTANVEKVKHFITKRDDQYRVSYGRRKEKFPRQCVFFASTNNYNFLRGTTGNRRFWPVPVDKTKRTKQPLVDLDEYERGQIWAEALHYYNLGETLYLSEELEEVAREMQTEHTERDPREDRIQWYLDVKLPERWDKMNAQERRVYLDNVGDDLQPDGVRVRTKVCIQEIWVEAFGGTLKDMAPHNTRFITEYLRNKATGWKIHKSSMRISGYGTQKGYYRELGDIPTGVNRAQEKHNYAG